ncbi:MAG: hypothetical protein RRY07_06510 [Bacteroidaceae bacterium]
MPVLSEREQSSFVGGGMGSSSDPSSRSEYDSLLESGNWTGGFVLMRDDGTYPTLQFVPASEGSDGSGNFSNPQNPIMGLYCTGMVPPNSGSGLMGLSSVDGYDFIVGEWVFIGSGSVNDSSLLKRELIHVFQDSKKMLSSGATGNAEFQEHLLGDLMLYSGENRGKIGTTQSSGYMDWL